jgi:hypothetical protein
LRDLANRDLTESDHPTDKLLDAVFLTNVCFWRESHDAVDGINFRLRDPSKTLAGAARLAPGRVCDPHLQSGLLKKASL